MSNSKYIKGRKFEYEIKKMYEDLGYLVFRTAGSHSIADLIAIPILATERYKTPILIQCKTTEKKKSYRKEIKEFQKALKKYHINGIFTVKINNKGIKQTWIYG